MISINLEGTKKDALRISEALEKCTTDMERAWVMAGVQSAKLILRQPGVQRYKPQIKGIPFEYSRNPTKAAAQRRYIFWALAHGQMDIPYRRGQSYGSEMYGKQYYVESHPPLTTVVGNRASYARWLASETQQARQMRKRGWRRLADVAREQYDPIIGIYERLTKQAIDRLGIGEE